MFRKGIEFFTVISLGALLLLGPGISAQDPAKDLLKAGAKAPDFTAALLDGKKISLSATVKKNKLTLVNFWALWCGPCLDELPKLDKLASKYRKQGFEVIATNVGAGAREVAKYWTKNHFTLKSALNGDPISTQYKVDVIPCNYLIGKNGKIVAAMIGYQEKEIIAALKKAGIK